MAESGKKIFAARLRYAREELRKLNQAQLAEKTGLPATSISHFENPDSPRKPSFDNLQRLAKALEVTTDYLLGRADEPLQRSDAVDELYRNMQLLSEADREIAKSLIDRLVDRGKEDKE